LVFGATCAEAAAFCLNEQGHDAPAKLQIDGLTPGQFKSEVEIDWNPLDETMARFNADMEVATEDGACAIAALLMPHLTGLTAIERSVKGRGLEFDFWLGDISDQDRLFQRKARLEVSGIRHGSASQIKYRVNIKLKQITPSDLVALGYVCVVEFSTPQAQIVEKCRTIQRLFIIRLWNWWINQCWQSSRAMKLVVWIYFDQLLSRKSWPRIWWLTS
jgi:hypothetical protein